MLPLVRDGETLAGVAGRLPPRREFRPHALDGRVLLPGCPGRVESPDQQSGDPLLLAQQRAPRGFRRVRREHGLDAQAPEQRDHVLEAHAAPSQPGKALVETARLGRAAVVHVLPAAAHAMHLLRQVDHLEPGRERADQVLGFAGLASLCADDQLHRLVRVALSTADRRLPVGLHRLEELLAALVPEHLAHQLAKQVHVVAQRGVLEGKEDAFAGHVRRWCCLESGSESAARGTAAESFVSVPANRTKAWALDVCCQFATRTAVPVPTPASF